MNTKEIDIIDILFTAIMVYASYYITRYIIMPLLFPEDNGCGCNKGVSPTATVQVIPADSRELNPAQKACVAVGFCDEVEVGFYTREENYEWKKHIIANADKIFTAVKTGKRKVEKGGKGKKSTKTK